MGMGSLNPSRSSVAPSLKHEGTTTYVYTQTTPVTKRPWVLEQRGTQYPPTPTHSLTLCSTNHRLACAHGHRYDVHSHIRWQPHAVWQPTTISHLESHRGPGNRRPGDPQPTPQPIPYLQKSTAERPRPCSEGSGNLYSGPPPALRVWWGPTPAGPERSDWASGGHKGTAWPCARRGHWEM